MRRYVYVKATRKYHKIELMQNMKRIYSIISLLLLCVFMPMQATLTAQTANHELKARADSAYASEDFETALKGYLQLASQGENAAIYYNLGSTYYRLDSMARAVLWFERASQLDPSDDDIRFNLAMARNKTVDRIIPRHEMFFVSAWKTLMHGQSVSEWAGWAIGSFAAMLMLVGLYIYSSRIVLRKIGFFGAGVALLLCVLANVMAYNLRQYNNTHTAGIIMEPAVTVRSTPTKSGTDLFVIHEGTRVEIRDNSMRDWAEIQIADGKVGWIERSVYEAI